MERSDLILEIRRLVKDTNTDPSVQRWVDAVLIARANIVQDEMAAVTDILLKRATLINIVSGTAEYGLPTTFIHEESVQVLNDDSVYVPLTKKSEQELDMFSKTWRDDTGYPPTNYYIRTNAYIGLYPIPNKAKTSGLRINYYSYPAALSTDEIVPFDGDYKYIAFHEGICFGVARLCKMDEQDWVNADKFEQKYATSITELKRLVSQGNEEIRIPNLYESTRHKPRRTR